MARYDYLCVPCRHEFEVVRGMNELGSSTCPRCDGYDVRRVYSVPRLNLGATTQSQRTAGQQEKHLPPQRQALNGFRGTTIERCTFENCGSAIRADGASIRGKDLRIVNCGTVIEGHNSHFDLENIHIE